MFVKVIREIQVLLNGGNFLTSRQLVSFSRINNFNMDIYLKERYIAVDTPVGQSETLCVLQVDQICLMKNYSEKFCKFCWVYL